MKKKSYLKTGLILASMLIIAACAKSPGSMDRAADSDNNGEVSSRGLGEHNRFSGQEQGESYTTQAPHNQVYLFKFDNSAVAEKYVPSIQAQAKYLKSHPGAHILLSGHTDERGSREYNIALGERRAASVADLMRLSGVNRKQMRVVSYGKERPVNFDHTEQAHQQNRRVELIYEATR